VGREGKERGKRRRKNEERGKEQGTFCFIGRTKIPRRDGTSEIERDHKPPRVQKTDLGSLEGGEEGNEGIREDGRLT